MKAKMAMTKGSLILLLIFLMNIHSKAQQVSVSPNIPPPYPIHLEDYLDFGGNAVVTLRNLSNEPLELKLITHITNNRGISGFVKMSWNPVIPILLNPLEIKVLNGRQLQEHFNNLTENNVSISGIDVNQIIRTETLPEGMYEVCVKAFKVSNNQQVSGDFGCTQVFITNYDPPIILLPQDESIVKYQTPQFVNFTWTPTGMGGITKYRLEIVDMTAVGLFNANDAFDGQNLVQPIFVKENLVATTYPFSIEDPPLTLNHKYAIRVTAYDPNNTISFKNEGKSAISTFTYKMNQIIYIPPNNEVNNQIQDPPIILSDAPPPKADPPNGACVSNTNFEGQFSAKKQTISNGTDILAGHFVVKNTVFTKNNGGSFNGKGTIKINFLNTQVDVEFTNISIDATDRLMSGKITAKVTSNSLINSAMATSKDGTMENLPNAQGLFEKFEEANRQVSQLNPDAAIDLPIAWDNEAYNLGIVGLIFEPTEAFMNAILPIDIPEVLNGEWLNISQKGMPFQPNGFGEPEIKVNLAKDKNLKLSNTAELIIKGGADETFAILDCDGFNSLTINGTMEFSREVALPVDEEFKVITDTEVKVNVPFEIEGAKKFKKFLLSGLSFNHPFVVPEAQDFVIEPGEVTFDFATSKNGSGFLNAFPEKGNDWLGIYIQSLTLTMPKGFKKEGGGMIELAMNDFLVDKMGVSGKFSAEGEPLKKGSIANWNFSLNEIDLEVKNSKLSGGGLAGVLQIPLGKKADYGFTALVQKGDEKGANYEFELETKEEIEADLFLAKIKLFDGSKVLLTKLNDGKFETKAQLNGEISVNFSEKPNDKTNVAKFKLPKVKFEKLSITGKDVANYIPEFDMKFISLQNQDGIQAKVSNAFELKLNELAFEKSTQDGKKLVGMSLDLGVALFGGDKKNSTGPGASTAFILWAAYDKNERSFKFEKGQLNKISVEGDIGVASLKGEIEIYNQDQEFGNGFRGEIEAIVTGVNAGVGVKMQFGRTLPEKGNYKYWYFDAMVKFPDPGLVIPSTPASLYGFGGGAWCNMLRSGNDEPIQPNQYTSQKGGESGAPTVSGVSFTPEKGKGGFSASVLFGISGKQEAFNGDLTFSMDLNTENLAVEKIVLEGNGYVMQSPDATPRNPEAAFVKCAAKMTIDRMTRKFYGNFGVDIEVASMINGSGEVAFKFQMPEVDEKGQAKNQPNLKWFIKVGYWTPDVNPFEDDTRISATVGFDGIVKYNIKYQGYFMVGNDLGNGLPSLPDYILDVTQELGAPQIQPLPAQVSQSQNLAFAFGAGIQLNAGFAFEIGKLEIAEANLQAEAAFDVLLADLNATCDGQEIGFNGWYAQGQAYAYVFGNLEILAIELASFKAGSVFEIKTPNPTYLAGTVFAEYKVGGIKKSRTGHFKRGTACNVQTDLDPFSESKLISWTKPTHETEGVDPLNPIIEIQFEYKKGENIKIFNAYTESYEYYKFEPSAKLTKNGKEVPIENIKWENGFKRAVLTPKDNLNSQENYQIIAYASIKKGGELEAEEEIITDFKTGDRPAKFNMSDIVKAYPMHKQRYLMKESFAGGAGTGHIVLKQNMCYMVVDAAQKGKKTYAKFVNLATGNSTETLCDCVGQNNAQIRFSLPIDLENEQIYELKIVQHKPYSGNNNQNQGDGIGNFDSNESPDLNPNLNLAAEAVYVVLFEGLYFRTSKFNNMNEKLASYKVAKVGEIERTAAYSGGGNGVYAGDATIYHQPIVLLEGGEPFDRFEIDFYTVNMGGESEQFGKLIRTFQVKSGNWHQEVYNKFRKYNTLPASSLKTQMISWNNSVNQVSLPSGFPFYSKQHTAFSFGSNNFHWMKNHNYYEQKLRQIGALKPSEGLAKVGYLSNSEINAAKAQNGGGGGVMINNNIQLANNIKGGLGQNLDQLNLNNNVNKFYFALIDFEPVIAANDVAKVEAKILQKAAAINPFIFYQTFSLLKTVGWPVYPKGNHSFKFKVWEPRKINGKAWKDYPNWIYETTKY